jgi:hypothetical protein
VPADRGRVPGSGSRAIDQAGSHGFAKAEEVSSTGRLTHASSSGHARPGPFRRDSQEDGRGHRRGALSLGIAAHGSGIIPARAPGARTGQPNWEWNIRTSVWWRRSDRLDRSSDLDAPHLGTNYSPGHPPRIRDDLPGSGPLPFRSTVHRPPRPGAILDRGDHRSLIGRGVHGPAVRTTSPARHDESPLIRDSTVTTRAASFLGVDWTRPSIITSFLIESWPWRGALLIVRNRRSRSFN